MKMVLTTIVALYLMSFAVLGGLYLYLGSTRQLSSQFFHEPDPAPVQVAPPAPRDTPRPEARPRGESAPRHPQGVFGTAH